MTAFEPETQRYTAIPMYKNSFTEVGEYTNTISTGKVVSLKYTTDWRYGQCIIELTKKEHDEIIKTESVCLTDYHCEFEESTDGWSSGAIIHNEDTYTLKEIQEIIKSTCDHDESSDDEEEIEPTIVEPTVVKRDEHGNYNVTIVPPIENDEDDDLTLDDCTQCGLDNGGWDLDETYYYIYGGCVLVPECENIEDYVQDDGSYANKEDPASVFENISIHI